MSGVKSKQTSGINGKWQIAEGKISEVGDRAIKLPRIKHRKKI